ncbi:MAG: hypothetical protein AB7Q29_04025 [Vicinamibacterales bacterium]
MNNDARLPGAGASGTGAPEADAPEAVRRSDRPDEIARREFLRRLGRGATFAAPVVAAVVLKPSRVLAY